MATRGFWQDAFTVTTNQPLSKEEEVWLDSIADKIVKRGLAQPAILFLETTKPVHFITGQAARFVDPIFSIVVPGNGIERFAELLEKRPAAERLIQALEHPRTTPPDPTKQ
ncbi:MAG: hypothetical protein HZB91_00305 [Elusimicrobia bacterium]|nr:hypothetical protein [Elusimicrobiota bacterium]